MTEEEILKFRNRAEAYFNGILDAEGYDQHRREELGFFVAMVLEDTLDLLEDVETNNPDTDAVMDHIHMHYTNREAFEDGHKILMFKDTEI